MSNGYFYIIAKNHFLFSSKRYVERKERDARKRLAELMEKKYPNQPYEIKTVNLPTEIQFRAELK